MDIFQLLIQIFNIFWQIIKSWWWVLPPFLLWNPFQTILLWWRQEIAFKQREYVMLEIKLPREILKPIRAMEQVCHTFTVIAGDQEPGNFREKWVEGGTSFYPSISLEIAGISGESHFFIRVEKTYQSWVESAIYAQYPDVEIVEVKDYTRMVPQDIPDDNWDLEGQDWILKKPDCYPIKTYEQFETGTEPKEEKRIDPLAKLLEGLSVLKEGEQIWIQILLKAPESKWIDEGKKIANELAKRPEKKEEKPKPMILQAAEILIKGPQEEKQKEQEQPIYTEMMMTPGEREVVRSIEQKVSKSGAAAVIRLIYLAKKEVIFKPHMPLGIQFITSFNAENLNAFGKIPKTATKVKSALFWFWDKRRAFLKKRKLFYNYVNRFVPLFPYPGKMPVLNTEELATIFHFPGRTPAPAPFVSRIEAKKGEPPAGLPTE